MCGAAETLVAETKKAGHKPLAGFNMLHGIPEGVERTHDLRFMKPSITKDALLPGRQTRLSSPHPRQANLLNCIPLLLLSDVQVVPQGYIQCPVAIPLCARRDHGPLGGIHCLSRDLRKGQSPNALLNASRTLSGSVCT